MRRRNIAVDVARGVELRRVGGAIDDAYRLIPMRGNGIATRLRIRLGAL